LLRRLQFLYDVPVLWLERDPDCVQLGGLSVGEMHLLALGCAIKLGLDARKH
jgi:hypothetical protein